MMDDAGASRLAAPLAPLFASQSILPGSLHLTAQIDLALLDQHAHQEWVLLEHGMSFRDWDDREARS